MSAVKILWGQVLLVSALVLAFIWAATEWTAWKLGFQSKIGRAWLETPWLACLSAARLLLWWFAYDVYARDVFVEGAHMAASGGIAAIIVAITMSVWRAHEVKQVTTYGRHAGRSGKPSARREPLPLAISAQLTNYTSFLATILMMQRNYRTFYKYL
jgi:type IV secretory pathway TraG/TraD family ATPase VirD4